MAGYVFAVGGEDERKSLDIIKESVRSGTFSTYMRSLSPLPFEGTLADYMSMKPGDNIYFFCKRKYYGVGELVSVGLDCKYCNYPQASALENFQYDHIKDELLVDFGIESANYRWVCTFKGSPHFFEEGIDTDEILTYKPNTFKMLRAFWKVSFIKLSDEENASLKEIFLLRRQKENREKIGLLPEDTRTHEILRRHDLTKHIISPRDMLLTCNSGFKVKHEMALEAAVVYDLCHDRIPNMGPWDYVSHQVVASPFKPIDYMDKIDVLAMRYLPETKIPCKYLVVELKRDRADNYTIDQVLKYVDWICAEYAYGDYDMIEASIIAAEYPDGIADYYRDVVQRYYTMGSHPVRNKQWNALKLLKYTYSEGSITYEDITPPKEDAE